MVTLYQDDCYNDSWGAGISADEFSKDLHSIERKFIDEFGSENEPVMVSFRLFYELSVTVERLETDEEFSKRLEKEKAKQKIDQEKKEKRKQTLRNELYCSKDAELEEFLELRKRLFGS